MSATVAERLANEQRDQETFRRIYVRLPMMSASSTLETPTVGKKKKVAAFTNGSNDNNNDNKQQQLLALQPTTTDDPPRCFLLPMSAVGGVRVCWRNAPTRSEHQRQQSCPCQKKWKKKKKRKKKKQNSPSPKKASPSEEKPSDEFSYPATSGN